MALRTKVSHDFVACAVALQPKKLALLAYKLLEVVMTCGKSFQLLVYNDNISIYHVFKHTWYLMGKYCYCYYHYFYYYHLLLLLLENYKKREE